MGFLIKNYKRSVVSFLLLVDILFSEKVCSSSSQYDSCPSFSCGSIQNISYPFRRKGDPKNCGIHSFELTCDDVNVTTIYLNSKKFIVKSITNHNSSIRLLDPGYSSSSSSACPLHFLTPHDINSLILDDPDSLTTFRYDFKYYNTWLTYISCSSYINTTTVTFENYTYYEVPDTTLCGFNSHFSNENYSYLIYGNYSPLSPEYLENSCRFKRATMVSKKVPDYTYGFELSLVSIPYCFYNYLSAAFHGVKCKKF